LQTNPHHRGGLGVQHHNDFRSQYLPHPRPISVWLPPGYDHGDARYPVLYLHDGQNLFDPRLAYGGNAWHVDLTATRCILHHEVRPLILVGVGNTPDRIKEYGPSRKRPGDADLAKNYGRFLVSELKPFIDVHYRTLPGPADTGVGGSSMGGLISLYLCRWHSGVFGRCAAMSPSLWYNREAFLRSAHTRTEWMKHCRIWLDFGDHEGNTMAGMKAGLHRTRELAQSFRDASLKDDEHFHYAEIEGGHHNEAAWAGRFDRVLRFLFPAG